MAVELVVRQRVDALARALPGAERGDPSAIHQARVATRRLREALALTHAGGRRKVADMVRRLTRALGPVRELDVTLDIVASRSGSGDIAPAAAIFLRDHVRAERERLYAGLVRHVQRCDLDKLRRKAMAASGSVEPGRRRAADPKHVTAARERAARRAAALRDAIQHATAIYLPDRLHDVRIAAKKLRYAMEIVRELSRSRARVRLQRLKTAQELLGGMHDLEIVIARTRAVQASPSAPDLRVSADLDRFVRRLENECRQLHAQYIASRGELLRICDDVIAAGASRGRAAA